PISARVRCFGLRTDGGTEERWVRAVVPHHRPHHLSHVARHAGSRAGDRPRTQHPRLCRGAGSGEQDDHGAAAWPELQATRRGRGIPGPRPRSASAAIGSAVNRVFYFPVGSGGGAVKSWRATRRALFRIARVALAMLMDARETASTSEPTWKASRMSFPANCAANCLRSTEK